MAGAETPPMTTVAPDSPPSTGRSALVGTGFGTGVFLCFLVAGLLFGSWDVAEFLSRLTVETVGWLLLLCGMTIATFAIPIALYLHLRLLAPSSSSVSSSSADWHTASSPASSLRGRYSV